MRRWRFGLAYFALMVLLGGMAVPITSTAAYAVDFGGPNVSAAANPDVRNMSDAAVQNLVQEILRTSGPTIQSVVPRSDYYWNDMVVAFSYRPPNDVFVNGISDNGGNRPFGDQPWNLAGSLSGENIGNFVFAAPINTINPYLGVLEDVGPNAALYAYVVRAPGGIDLRATAGAVPLPGQLAEHSVGYIGGVRSEFIAGAIQYNDRAPVRAWENRNSIVQMPPVVNPENLPVERWHSGHPFGNASVSYTPPFFDGHGGPSFTTPVPAGARLPQYCVAELRSDRAARAADSAGSQCILQAGAGSVKFGSVPDPYDGQSFAMRPKLFHNRALDMNKEVTTWPANENPHQIFIPERVSASPGYYRLKNVITNQYLIHDGTNLLGVLYSDSDRAMWRFERTGDGWFRIISKDGRFLTRPVTDSNSVFVVDSTGGVRDQDQWNIARIGGEPLNYDRISPSAQPMTRALGAPPGVPGGSSVTVQAPFNNPGSTQRWRYTYDPHRGAYILGNYASTTVPGRWLNLARRSTLYPGTTVEMWDGGHDDQYWIVRKNPTGFYEFLNYDMPKTFGLTSVEVYALTTSSTAIGTVVNARRYGLGNQYGADTQQWQICLMQSYDSTLCER